MVVRVQIPVASFESTGHFAYQLHILRYIVLQFGWTAVVACALAHLVLLHFDGVEERTAVRTSPTE